MKHLSYEILNQLISEVYPFTSGNIKEFENHLDFEWLSRNKNVKWSVDLISEFKNQWNWESLEENKAVFENLTLGLFFPDEVDLPVCSCNKRLEFCDYASCRVNYNKFHFAKSLYTQYPDDFITLTLMCESGFIDSGMLSEFYTSKDPENLMRFKVPYNS